MKEIGTRQKDISELQKHIGTYGKTRDTYAKYKASGWDKDFYEANRADITLHKAAKKFFNEHNYTGKMPSINALKQAWATLDCERKSLYKGYKELKENYLALNTALANAQHILGITPDGQVREAARTQKSHSYGER